MYLYRTVDSEGNTIDFCLNELRNKQAPFQESLGSFIHVQTPRYNRR